MVKFPSDLSAEKLSENWNEHTSPARFAGSDDTMDLIFMSKRKGDSVRLVRKARSAHEPFSCVFRGKIKSNGNGSEIVGVFTKSIFDYLFTIALVALVFYMRSYVIERSQDLGAINVILIVVLVSCALLLYNRRATKRKYAEFIFRITEKEIPLFLTRQEKKNQNNDKAQ